MPTIAVDLTTKTPEGIGWIAQGVAQGLERLVHKHSAAIALVGDEQVACAVMKHVRGSVYHVPAVSHVSYKQDPRSLLRLFSEMKHVPESQRDTSVVWGSMLADRRVDGVVTLHDTGAPVASLRTHGLYKPWMQSLLSVVPTPRKQLPYCIVGDAGLRSDPQPRDYLWFASNALVVHESVGMYKKPRIMLGALSRDRKTASLESQAAYDLLEGFEQYSPLPYSLVGFGKPRDILRPGGNECSVFIDSARVVNGMLTIAGEVYRDVVQYPKTVAATSLWRRMCGGLAMVSGYPFIRCVKEHVDVIQEFCYERTGFFYGTTVMKLNSDTNAQGVAHGITGVFKKISQQRCVFENEYGSRFHSAIEQFSATQTYKTIMGRYTDLKRKDLGDRLRRL